MIKLMNQGLVGGIQHPQQVDEQSFPDTQFELMHKVND